MPANTAAAPSTDVTNRITIVAVGGFPGAGVRTQVTLSAALMRARGFEAVEIYTDSHHVPVPITRCQVCVDVNKKHGKAPHTQCNLCPLSLDVPSLIDSIDKGISFYANQTDFQQGDKRIVLFVAGRNVLGCPALLAKASVIIWVGLQGNIGLCAIRRLRADSLWPPDLGEDLTDPVVSRQLMFLTEDTTFGLNRLYAHSHQYERVVGRHETVQYCEVADNSIIEVATVFNRFVFNTIDVTPNEPSQAELASLISIPDAPAEAVRGVSTAEAGATPSAPSTKYTADTAQVGPLLFHYTSDKLLYPILESGYLIPGGRTSTRTYVFMSRHRVSTTGALPDKFKKRMTNVCIELDGTAMLRDNVTLVLGNNDVVLCQHSISTKYIISATYFTQPKHTLYKRPTHKELSLAFTKDCPCAHCRRSQALGTQWCLGQC